jgi:anaerobic magnesium-protoporphyrin IX monomethyl ester cyclase
MDVGEGSQRHFVVNAQAGTILETNRDAVLLMEFLPPDVPANVLANHFPALASVFQA